MNTDKWAELNTKIDKQVKKKQSTMASYMSNTKWKKLFNAIGSANVDITSSKMSPMYGDLERLDDVALEICGDKFTADNCGACPERLRNIAFILITVNSTENMQKLKNAIDGVGCLYEYEILDFLTIKIYGYK